MSWSGEVVDSLYRLKTAGVASFDLAWKLAMKSHPPGPREYGYRETLFVEIGSEEERSPYEFLRSSAEDAWHGRRPVLKHLSKAFAFALLEEGGSLARPGNRVVG